MCKETPYEINTRKQKPAFLGQFLELNLFKNYKLYNFKPHF